MPFSLEFKGYSSIFCVTLWALEYDPLKKCFISGIKPKSAFFLNHQNTGIQNIKILKSQI